MSSADPERRDDAWVPEHVAPRQPAQELLDARWALWKELTQGQPSRSEREVMLAALRDVAALAARWAAIGEPGAEAAALDLMEAVAGTSVASALQAGRPADGLHTYSQRLQGRPR